MDIIMSFNHFSFFTQTFLQFTVLDEDILCQLVSFFKDLLHVDVGHRWNDALHQEEDVTST